jgi:hypothetical protein
MIMLSPLREVVTPANANLVTETRDNNAGGKDLFMSGIFIQGNKKNQNNRVYPILEITKAVNSLKQKIVQGYSVLGEADHPKDLNINLDRVSHMIVDMSMSGNDGVGKLKLLPTPMGNICTTLLESGVKLGVSSRGSGNVDAQGNVSDYNIITVDIVANPSAPDAYPKAIYEQLMNNCNADSIWDVASSVQHDPKARRHLKTEMMSFIQDLGRK